MHRLITTAAALLLLMAAAPSDATAAACIKRGALIECKLTKSLTTVGTQVTLKSFGGNGFDPTFRIILEWREADLDHEARCHLSGWFAIDSGQSYNQIHLGGISATGIRTGNGSSNLLTAGREALLIERAGVWLTPNSCSGGVVATYAKRAELLFR